MIVKKKQGKIVEAYRLGDKGAVIRNLMEQEFIVERTDGTYEIFSQEAVNGSGEIASENHYVKIDSSGKPYPNSPEFFKKNHRKTDDNLYEQIPVELRAWTVEEGMGEEIRFLIDNKLISINEKNEDKYFEAFLWGTKLSAAKDAVIVFYAIEKNKEGYILSIDFNFVKREEFDRTYDIIK